MDPVERREDSTDVRLLRPQGEFAEPFARKNAGDIQAHGPSDVVFTAEQGFNGDGRRFLKTDEQNVARSGAELGGKRRRDDDARLIGQPVKRPESLVDAVDDDPARAASGRFVADKSARHDERSRGRPAVHGPANIARERVTNEAC